VSFKRRTQAACISACISFLPCAAVAQGTLWLKPPAVPEVTWRGMLVTEGTGVGGGHQILYPAPGVVGLLAAIFTHAAISQGVQSSQRKAEQDAADRVLEPYREALRNWNSAALWDAAVLAAAPTLDLKRWDPASTSNAQPSIDVVPIYTLAQDEGVLTADVAIKHSAPAQGAAGETLVRVISSPHAAADARNHWSANDSRQLKDTAARMLAHAIDVAQRHPAATADEPAPRTHRYLQGGVERSERAQLLSGDCARAVLRTLRGGLLSVPLRPVEGEVCNKAATF
jgi:hypothetical protein